MEGIFLGRSPKLVVFLPLSDSPPLILSLKGTLITRNLQLPLCAAFSGIYTCRGKGTGKLQWGWERKIVKRAKRREEARNYKTNLNCPPKLSGDKCKTNTQKHQQLYKKHPNIINNWAPEATQTLSETPWAPGLSQDLDFYRFYSILVSLLTTQSDNKIICFWRLFETLSGEVFESIGPPFREL